MSLFERRSLSGAIVALAVMMLPMPLVAETLAVTFRVNDAFVKDRMVDQVEVSIRAVEGETEVAAGTTDSEGLLRFDLPAGEYRASFSRHRYIPLETTFQLERDGQVITTTLSMMLEAEGAVGTRRVRVILNWGAEEYSQVRDVDAHLLCGCSEKAHVYFAEREHLGEGHAVDLDVDDMDWGGPETITLENPPPGRYLYWLHDYSDGPGTLGSSEIVVRVLFGDRVVDEFRVPPDARERYWSPFEAIEIGPDLEARIVLFEPTSGPDPRARRAPEGYETEGGELGTISVLVIVGVILAFAGFILRRLIGGRRA